MFVPRIIIGFAPFAAYSFGVAFCRKVLYKAPTVSAHPLEAIAVLAAAVVIAAMRPATGVLVYILLSAVAAFIAGVALGRLFLPAGRPAGTREFEDEKHASATTLWKRWVAFSHVAADFQVRLILAACYLVFVGGVAVLFRLTRPSAAPVRSAWVPRASVDPTLESVGKPF